MANQVTAQVFGGEPKSFNDVKTVLDIKRAMSVPNHTATVNGEAASNDTVLEDFAFVTLAPAVKGA